MSMSRALVGLSCLTSAAAPLTHKDHYTVTGGNWVGGM